MWAAHRVQYIGEGVDADSLDYDYGIDCGDIQTFKERKGVFAGHRHFDGALL